MDSCYHFKGNVARIFLKEKKKTLFWFTVISKENPHNWNIMDGKLNVLKKKIWQQARKWLNCTDDKPTSNLVGPMVFSERFTRISSSTWLSLFSCSVVLDSLQLHGLQHTRLPCPSLSPRACSNSCLSSQWCHPIISYSVAPFSSCLQSFPASRSFPVSQLFASDGPNTGASVSASVLPVNI